MLEKLVRFLVKVYSETAGFHVSAEAVSVFWAFGRDGLLTGFYNIKHHSTQQAGCQ